MNFSRISRAFLFTSALVFTVCTDVFAESLTLTVKDAVKYAVDGNLKIKESDLAVRTAQRKKNYAWNSISPSIKASGSISKAAPETTIGDIKVSNGKSDSANVSLGASLNIGLSPSIATTVKGARLNYEKSLIDLDTTVRTIEMNVRTAFYQILYEQDNIVLQKQNAETARVQYSTNLERYERGVLPRLDVLNSQIAYQNAKLTLQNAETTLKNDIATFKNLLGLKQTQEITLKGSLDDYIALSDVSIDGVSGKSDKITSLEKQVEIAKNSLLATRLSAYGPTISAGYSYNMSNKAENFSDGDTWTKGGTISVGVSIPLDGLLPWSSGLQSVRNQQDALESLSLQLQDAKNTQLINIDNYYNQVKNLESAIELQSQSLEYAGETYSLTLDAYNNGTKDILNLQTARNNRLEAAVNLKRQAYNLAVAVLNLENALGVSFGTLSGDK